MKCNLLSRPPECTRTLREGNEDAKEEGHKSTRRRRNAQRDKKNASAGRGQQCCRDHRNSFLSVLFGKQHHEADAFHSIIVNTRNCLNCALSGSCVWLEDGVAPSLEDERGGTLLSHHTRTPVFSLQCAAVSRRTVRLCPAATSGRASGWVEGWSWGFSSFHDPHHHHNVPEHRQRCSAGLFVQQAVRRALSLSHVVLLLLNDHSLLM